MRNFELFEGKRSACPRIRILSSWLFLSHSFTDYYVDAMAFFPERNCERTVRYVNYVTELFKQKKRKTLCVRGCFHRRKKLPLENPLQKTLERLYSLAPDFITAHTGQWFQ